MRDLADAAHALCALHGTTPTVIEQAGITSASGGLCGWLRQAAARFDAERALLMRLIAAVGPLPSTPGQAQSDAAVLAQRHALLMLAQSDRAGCAVGAAAALLLEWTAIRDVIDVTCDRTGITIIPRTLPDAQDITAALATLEITPGSARAIVFGAQQLLAQHRGLWQLLEARASARRDS